MDWIPSSPALSSTVCYLRLHFTSEWKKSWHRFVTWAFISGGHGTQESCSEDREPKRLLLLTREEEVNINPSHPEALFQFAAWTITRLQTHKKIKPWNHYAKKAARWPLLQVYKMSRYWCKLNKQFPSRLSASRDRGSNPTAPQILKKTIKWQRR